MRDDIHKTVPRPRSVQNWVRLTQNDADRGAGRPYDAFIECQRDSARRELSKTFVQNLNEQSARAATLLGPLGDVVSPRDLGGRGGPAEMEVLTETKRLIAGGFGAAAPRMAIQNFMEGRAQADIRATAAVLPPRDRKTPVMLESMHADAARADYRSIAESVCSGEVYERRGKRAALDIDADLRMPAKGGSR